MSSAKIEFLAGSENALPGGSQVGLPLVDSKSIISSPGPGDPAWHYVYIIYILLVDHRQGCRPPPPFGLAPPLSHGGEAGATGSGPPATVCVRKRLPAARRFFENLMSGSGEGRIGDRNTAVPSG